MSKLHDLKYNLEQAEKDLKDKSTILKFARESKIDNDKLEEIRKVMIEARDKAYNIEKSIEVYLVEQQEKYNLKEIKQFENVDEDGTGGTNYFIFEKEHGTTKDDITGYLVNVYNVETEGIQINSMYDCTGRKFSYPLDIEESKNYFIASQRWGLDV